MRKFCILLLLVISTTGLNAQTDTLVANGVDHEFLTALRAKGVWEACAKMDIDFEEVFAPMTTSTGHPYRRYRWSVSNDGSGTPVIHALPPEEEMGWTPWERWHVRDGQVVHTEWVQYPVKEPIRRGIIPWYMPTASQGLKPRFMKTCKDLETRLKMSRVEVAADWLGLDFKKTFIDALPETVQQDYLQFRWAVIPHVLAADGPVIYALPPMNKSDDWPWESWYTDGDVPIIHHVHYTSQKEQTTGQWSESTGAPQRPPEIYEHRWHWYDDKDMKPALSH